MGLGAEFEDAVGHLLGVVVGDEGESALGENIEAEVAASFGPFVGLLGEDGADEADDRVAVREDADGVGAGADLAAEALVEVRGILVSLFGLARVRRRRGPCPSSLAAGRSAKGPRSLLAPGLQMRLDGVRPSTPRGTREFEPRLASRRSGVPTDLLLAARNDTEHDGQHGEGDGRDRAEDDRAAPIQNPTPTMKLAITRATSISMLRTQSTRPKVM